jgi:hypothetical protein
MGRCNEDPPGQGVYAVGEALEELAERLVEQWQRAFDLSRSSD